MTSACAFTDGKRVRSPQISLWPDTDLATLFGITESGGKTGHYEEEIENSRSRPVRYKGNFKTDPNVRA